MGCTSSCTVESSLKAVAANPQKGLPKLIAALQQTPKPGQEQAKAESDKKQLARIFELMPKALEDAGDQPKALVAGCAVIEHAVNLYNDNQGTNNRITACYPVAAIYPKQCQDKLYALMTKLTVEAREVMRKDHHESEIHSKQGKAICLAIHALMWLPMVADCKPAVFLGAMEENAGFTAEAKVSFALLLGSYVGKDPENAKIIIDNGGVGMLIPYVKQIDNFKYTEMQGPVCTVLEACLQHPAGHELVEHEQWGNIQSLVDESREAQKKCSARQQPSKKEISVEMDV